MENLRNKIQNDLKEAMRAKEVLKLSVLRMLATAIRNQEVASKKAAGELDDPEIQKVISSEIKKRKDSAVAYHDAGRQELEDQENQEAEILQAYLPPALSDEELDEIIKKTVATVEDKNFGKIMGQAMIEVKGRADGTRVSTAVKKILAT